ncbi:squalene/phytoene synthase family protein [Bordetella holmesii 44057]|nr:squalene/phytoene synthase family protein [Bordetella holmesii 44057]
MAVDHYENFPVASILLPRPLRQAVRDIYRYARAADDIADEGDADDSQRLSSLERFRHELHRIGSGPNQPGPPDLASIFDPWPPPSGVISCRSHRFLTSYPPSSRTSAPGATRTSQACATTVRARPTRSDD